MKIKLSQFEYEFSKEDADIVVPLILLLLGLFYTQLKKGVLWGGAAVYYILYFFLKRAFLNLGEILARLHHQLFFGCPYCKSREIIL
jgi:hypothetical protein